MGGGFFFVEQIKDFTCEETVFLAKAEQSRFLYVHSCLWDSFLQFMHLVTKNTCCLGFELIYRVVKCCSGYAYS